MIKKTIKINVVGENKDRKVTFDGKNTTIVPNGSLLINPNDPIKDSDASFDYFFDCWTYNGKAWDFEKDVASKLRDARVAGRTHFMIIVAEGAKMKQDGSMDNEVVGNGGAANQVAAMIKEYVGLDPRVTILGHTQRGGAPNARDRVNASRMGYYAVKLLAVSSSVQ